MNGNFYTAYIATDVPDGLCEILENVDYTRNTGDDIESARLAIIMLAENMAQKVLNYSTVPRRTNIDGTVIQAANFVNWGSYSEAELQDMLDVLDGLVRGYLEVLQ